MHVLPKHSDFQKLNFFIIVLSSENLRPECVYFSKLDDVSANMSLSHFTCLLAYQTHSKS